MIESEQQKNWKILYDAMENQQRVVVEFKQDSTRYACQGYVLNLTPISMLFEEYEGEKKDALSVHDLRCLISVRVVSTELKELEREIVKGLGEPDIYLRHDECSIHIVTLYEYVGRDVFKKLNKILNKFDYELIGVEACKDKLSFTIMKKD